MNIDKKAIFKGLKQPSSTKGKVKTNTFFNQPTLITKVNEALKMSKTITEQKQQVENLFFNTLKGDRKIRTAHNTKRINNHLNLGKEPLIGQPVAYISNQGLTIARPKTTKVRRVRGKNAFRVEGIVPKRKETKRRFEEYYMRSFNGKDIQASHTAYLHSVTRPNYLKYKLMREILEQKSLEEIKTLERKILDIKNNTDSDYLAIYSDEDETLSAKVKLVDKHPNKTLKAQTLQIDTRDDQYPMNIIQNDVIFGDKNSAGISSPSDNGILLGIK